jgi:hypothetical protein
VSPGTLVTISMSASDAVLRACSQTYYRRNAVDEPPASETQAEHTAKVWSKIEIIKPDRAPITAPLLDDIQYKLPLRVGKLFDSTLLPNNALHPMANVWSRRQLLEIGKVVSPLRLVAERERATQLADENTARIAAWLKVKIN